MRSVPASRAASTADHRLPSQCWISGSSPIHAPTAQTSFRPKAATSYSDEIDVGPEGRSSSCTAQAEPSHRSAYAVLTPPTTCDPTAHTSCGPVAATDSKIVASCSGASPSRGDRVQLARSEDANTPDAATPMGTTASAVAASRRNED